MAEELLWTRTRPTRIYRQNIWPHLLAPILLPLPLMFTAPVALAAYGIAVAATIVAVALRMRRVPLVIAPTGVEYRSVLLTRFIPFESTAALRHHHFSWLFGGRAAYLSIIDVEGRRTRLLSLASVSDQSIWSLRMKLEQSLNSY